MAHFDQRDTDLKVIVFDNEDFDDAEMAANSQRKPVRRASKIEIVEKLHKAEISRNSRTYKFRNFKNSIFYDQLHQQFFIY